LSNQKTAFAPRDNVIFNDISLKFMISQCSARYYNPTRAVDLPWDIIVLYLTLTRDVTSGNHALKQYGVRELLFVISYRTSEDLYIDLS
jgi:hypothetical protein